MSDNEKLKLNHIQRCTYLYVRQSTATQVGYNRESIGRLYILAERTIRLGWSKTQLNVIDENLAQPDSGAAERSGFTMMTTEIALGHVGLILHLALILPDGTRSIIPAVWTDLDRGKAQ